MKFANFLAAAAFVASGAAMASPSLVAEHRSDGTVGFEFIADSASPVAAFSFSVPLRNAEGFKVGEQCLQAPARFSLLCNVHEGQLKVIVFSLSPDAVVPSSNLGGVKLPAGSVVLAKSGEIEGLALEAYDSLAAKVDSEVLSTTTSRVENGRAVNQER